MQWKFYLNIDDFIIISFLSLLETIAHATLFCILQGALGQIGRSRENMIILHMFLSIQEIAIHDQLINRQLYRVLMFLSTAIHTCSAEKDRVKFSGNMFLLCMHWVWCDLLQF